MRIGNTIALKFIDNTYCIIEVVRDGQVLHESVNGYAAEDLYKLGVIDKATYEAESEQLKIKRALEEAYRVAQIKRAKDDEDYALYLRLKHKFGE